MNHYKIKIIDEDKKYLDPDTLCPFQYINIQLGVSNETQWDGHTLTPSRLEEETNKIVKEIMADLKTTITCFVEDVNPMGVGYGWVETERIKYDFMSAPNDITIKEKYEYLIQKIDKITDGLTVIEFHGPFDLLVSWVMGYADFGGDYVNKLSWEGKTLWDQGHLPITENKRFKTFINMKTPENELWFFCKDGKIVLEVENMECLKNEY